MFDKFSIPISIVIAGALIGAGFYMNSRSTAPIKGVSTIKQQQASSETIKNFIRPIDANDHILGSPNARVVIIEYSDTECPFCKNFHSIMLSLMKEYGPSGDVAWVYRHYPIAELHSKAPREAEALECAGALGGAGKFWEYTNKIYEVTPSNNGLDPKELVNIAKKIGIDGDKFTTCIDSGEFTSRVNADINNAKEIGASGTPYSVIVDTKNNEYYPVEGLLPYAQIKGVIDVILKS